jgi:hypothetical protein
MTVSRKRTWLLWTAPVVVLAAGGIAYASMMMQHAPADLDLSLTKASEHGFYVSSIESDLSPVTVGPIHNWTVEITTPDGRPVEQASLSIDGSMPQHGHGLPTTPQVTEHLGDGRYRIEGMKFNMPGWWTLTIGVEGPAGSDQTTFNLSL